ncbi:MAG: hypothetical protein ACERKD_23135 [Prolixibacteraceae bacterium]
MEFVCPYFKKCSWLTVISLFLMSLLVMSCQVNESEIEKCSCDNEPIFDAACIDSLKLDQIEGFWHPDSLILFKNTSISSDLAAIAGREYYYSGYQRRIEIEVFETHDMAIYNLELTRNSISIRLYEGNKDILGEWWLYDYQSYHSLIYFNTLNVNFFLGIIPGSGNEGASDSLISYIETIPAIIKDRVNKFVKDPSNESQ